MPSPADRDEDRTPSPETPRKRPSQRKVRARSPPTPPRSPPKKRQSITERLLGGWGSSRRHPEDSRPKRRASRTEDKERERDRDSKKSTPTSSPREKRKSDERRSDELKRRSSSSSTGTPVGKVREWLDECNAQHEHHCSGPAGDPEDAATGFRPAWLIDAVDRRLVRTRPGDRYLALSYVWERPGSRPTSRSPVYTARANVAAFEETLPDNALPHTISDAMWLCRKLGIRHLWVDRFCIVQDDEEDREYHIRNMAYIYANAYLTIVAASGDANAGLRAVTQKQPKGSRTGAKSHDELLLASRWNTRAWTLQELLYSRRALFVFEETITWECHCDLWQGSSSSKFKLLRSTRHACQNRISSGAYGFQHGPWPDLDEYARLAMEYSSRRLTYVEDTERAFLGVTSVLSKVFTGGFMYGMPVMFLDIALLWRPQASIRRRNLPQGFGNFNVIPSWSWLGWYFDGVPVDLTLWRAAADYVEESRPGKRGQLSRRFKSPFGFRVRSLVAWNFSNKTFTVPLATNGLQYRDNRYRKSITLPDGWSRSKSGAGFRHESDDVTVFKYPIPVAPQLDPHGEPLASAPALPGPYLSFRTNRAFFKVDFDGNKAPKDGEHPPLATGNIWGRTGRWIGAFSSHDSWLGIESSNYDGRGELLEFIAISASAERRGSHVFDAAEFKENMDEDEVVEFVNVLWIERVAGVAFRRGLGHVVRRYWDKEVKEEVDILLG
jgi:hypothetical protein